jgi:hypothetical protein
MKSLFWACAAMAGAYFGMTDVVYRAQTAVTAFFGGIL